MKPNFMKMFGLTAMLALAGVADSRDSHVPALFDLG